MYIPEGYGTVFPYMVVEQADKFVDFLKNAFDAKELGRTVNKGRIANVRMKIGTSAFMVSEANPAMDMKALPGWYYIYVENVDRTVDKAVSHGAIKMFDPTDMPYRDRQAGVTDPFGNTWWVSHRLVQEPYDG